MTNKPQTHNADLTHLPPALLPMTEQERWVVWDWELRKTKSTKKWTKAPRQARDPNRNAKSNDPSTWSSYDTAVNAVLAGNADGIGFMLSGSDIGAGDLDHARDPESGTIETWAERLCAEANGAYREITVSGTGMRIIGKCAGPEMHRKFTFDRKTGAGVELYRNTARYITVSGLEVGTCTELPPLDVFIDRVFARFSGQQTDGLDFNDVSGQSSVDHDDLIKNGAPEGERSELFQACIWHLASKGYRPEQITDELAQHPNGIGQKYADRLHAEVERSYEKWQARKHAAATGSSASAANDPWPQIHVRPGELPRIVNEAEDALLLLGREIYQRGGLIVRPVKSKLKAADDREIPGWQLIPVVRPYMVETFCCAAQFLRYDGRTRGYVVVNPPDNVAEAYLSRRGHWRLPVLTGIVHTPFLRVDGSIGTGCDYDAASGLLSKVAGQTFPPIPSRPTKEDAIKALATLDALIATFPFVTPADRSVALSAILTTLDRRSMATAPLHAFTSPVAGTGKSLLVDLAAILATGQPMPVISQGRSEEELEKRLGAALLAGDVGISVDNCEHELASVFLCQALTQAKLNIRVLGQSKNVETPVNATIFATGNNLVVSGDLTRRTLLCSLDAHCEHPEQRSFNTNVVDTARHNRGPLVVAALTALRAWHVAQPQSQAKPLGSFEDWSYRIRAPLLWLGHADPCNTMAKAKIGDPAREALTLVMTQWEKTLGLETAYTVQDVITRAINVIDLHVALMNVAGTRGSGNMVSNERLGRWLKRMEGKISGGLVLRQAGLVHGHRLWRLVQN